MEAVRGLEDFDYLWLIWEFSENSDAKKSLTVRPPRLGGNVRMGVFATRSPFRPNNLGLSCVKIDRIEHDVHLGPVVYVLGADLMDGTPIYDIKPYVAYADAHPEARSGFVDTTAWEPLQVVIPEDLLKLIPQEAQGALKATLAHDPRPRYHDDETRVYGMPFMNWDIRFKVADKVLTVVAVISGK
jgi:tRNA-Thr(GGU) m(6)t(6)A37 methyltransferase TsaA